MSKPKKSGSAIFMYCVIAITAVIAAVCFALYYANISRNGAVLWTGVASFTIMYHLWLRIIMGNFTKLFAIAYQQAWFKERKFEKHLYKMLKVKKWKDRALTYNPELFDLENRTLGQVADTTAKAETDHWINELISLSSLLFALIWGELWIFAITAFLAMLFDAQFIIIQRYNRPRLIRLMSRQRVELNKEILHNNK